MKHLKTYQIFESSVEEIKQYLFEIFSDLKGDGYRIHIDSGLNINAKRRLINGEYIRVEISKKHINEEVMFSIDHALAFLSDLGFNDVNFLLNLFVSHMRYTYSVDYKNLRKTIKENQFECITLEINN